MKVVLNTFILLILVSCARQDSSQFLQVGEVQVIPPRLSASSAIIDSPITLTADLRMEGVEIRYTKDGSEPTSISTKYVEPLTVDHASVYAFKAFHPNWKPSETSSLTLYQKGHSPKNIDWTEGPGDSYPGVGTFTLINHKKASLQFRDEQWQGFNSLASAKIDFGEATFIERLTIGYLIDQNSWIFPPEEVIIRIEGESPIQVSIDSAEQTEGIHLRDISIPIGKEVSSLVIEVKNTTLPEWHPGKGNAGWVFMDEWIFN